MILAVGIFENGHGHLVQIGDNPLGSAQRNLPRSTCARTIGASPNARVALLPATVGKRSKICSPRLFGFLQSHSFDDLAPQ